MKSIDEILSDRKSRDNAVDSFNKSVFFDSINANRDGTGYAAAIEDKENELEKRGVMQFVGDGKNDITVKMEAVK